MHSHPAHSNKGASAHSVHSHAHCTLNHHYFKLCKEMRNLLDTKISVYANVFATENQVCSLHDFLTDGSVKQQIDAIRQEADKAKRDAAKKMLPAATISGVFRGGHKAENLLQHSGLICIDVDAKDNPHITDWQTFKRQIATLKCVLWAALSASGRGVFLIIPIPPCDAKKHRLYFQSLALAFEKSGVKIDNNCSDICRLRGASYDDNAYINPHAEIFTKLPPSPKKPIAAAKMRHNGITDTRTTVGKVQECVRLVCAHKIDLTNGYSEWLKVGMALADLGESGREYFHLVSAQSASYNAAECDKKYSEILRSRRGAVNVGTFFHMCAAHGIKPQLSRTSSPATFTPIMATSSTPATTRATPSTTRAAPSPSSAATTPSRETPPITSPTRATTAAIPREPSEATVETWRRMLAEGSKAACSIPTPTATPPPATVTIVTAYSPTHTLEHIKLRHPAVGQLVDAFELGDVDDLDEPF